MAGKSPAGKPSGLLPGGADEPCCFLAHIDGVGVLTPEPLLPPPARRPRAGAFENVVQLLYKHVVPKPKSECNKTEQLGVSFAAGYIAGIFCAVVSHPADNLVSKMNSAKGVPASEAGQRVQQQGAAALCFPWVLGGRGPGRWGGMLYDREGLTWLGTTAGAGNPARPADRPRGSQRRPCRSTGECCNAGAMP